MRRLIASVVLASLFVVGCGGDESKDRDKDKAGLRSSKKDGGMKDKKEAFRLDKIDQAALAAPAGEAQPAGGDRKQAADAEKPQRKIIYTGIVSLVVEDFDKAETLLAGLVKEHDGYVANSEVTGEPGQPRHGSWTIRVPVAKGDDFRKDLLTLGELRRSSLDSRDVTDEYYDTKAVIKNLEAREEALRALYKEKIANSRLSELLEVDRELTSVRTQINVRKGQIQRWDKETEFTTYTLTIYDRRGYVPPESPDFGSSIGRTWSNSLDALKAFGKAIVLVVVALLPWVPVIALVVVPIVWLLRRAFRGEPALAVLAAVGPDRREPRRHAREDVPPVPQAVIEVVEESGDQERVRREGPEGD